jgi:predicted Zn finger-like uncharacterized protein
MTLVTRCPACNSIFRLTAIQLQMHDGEVSCGHCEQVFNGFSALMLVSESQIQSTELLAQTQASQNQPTSETIESMEDIQNSYDIFDVQPVSAGKTFRYWLVASLLLLVLLLGQFAHGYRAELSIAMPSLRPFLENYCVLVQCELDFPRHLALLSLESSDLHANPSRRPEEVTLLATIRNLAPFPQKLPALLLTLTDFDEQPLASRIITVEDCLDLESNKMVFAANSEVSIQCYLDTGELNAVGYRLELLYP